MEKHVLDVSWRSLWRIAFVVGLIAAGFLFWDIFVILFLAIIISSAFDTPVSFLQRYRIPRVLGALLMFLFVVGVFALLLYTIVPVAISEFTDLLHNLNSFEIPYIGTLNTSDLAERFDASLGGLRDLLFSGGASVISILTNVFGNIVLTVVTFILALYLTIDHHGVEKFLRAVLPTSSEQYVLDLYGRVRHKLGLWFQGQLLLMLIIGILIFLGLWMLGVPYSLVLGIIAGILEIVPAAGPLLAGIFAFIVAFSQSPTLGVYVAILFVAIQQLENHLLVPMVMQKTVGISPVVVVIALLAGSHIAGVLGIILAVPVAVILQELLEDWGKKKTRDQERQLF